MAVKDLHRGALIEWARFFFDFSDKAQNVEKKNHFEIFSNFAKHVPLYGSLCHEDQVIVCCPHCSGSKFEEKRLDLEML